MTNYTDQARRYLTGDVLDPVNRLAQQFERHDARVVELLDANSRFEQRARLAERELDAANRAMKALGAQLADMGRERDELAAELRRLKEGTSKDCTGERRDIRQCATEV